MTEIKDIADHCEALARELEPLARLNYQYATRPGQMASDAEMTCTVSVVCGITDKLPMMQTHGDSMNAALRTLHRQLTSAVRLRLANKRLEAARIEHVLTFHASRDERE